MPRQRVQVNRDALPDGVIRPAARVRPDAFRPVTPAQTQAGQLARALAQIEPTLGRFSQTLADRYKTSEFEKGKQAALDAEKSQQDVAQLIKEGQIPASASAWYRAGLMQEAGSILANKWHGDFIAQAAVALKDATTMEEFDSFAKGHLDQWTEANLTDASNKFFASGFDARREAFMLQERTNFAHQAGSRLAQQDVDQLHSNIMDSAFNDLNQGVGLESVAGMITGLLDERMQLNPLMGSANNLTAGRAIVNLAKRMNDPRVLDMLDMIRTGPAGRNGQRGTLGSIAAVAELRDQAEKDIATENHAMWSRQRQMDDAEKYEQKLEVLGGWVDQLMSADNPHTVNAGVAAESMRAIDPSAVGLIYDVQEAFTKRVLTDDPLVAANAWERVYMYPQGDPMRLDKADATQLLADRSISIPTYRSLIAAMDERDSGATTFLSDKWLGEAEQMLKRNFVNELGNLDAGENAVLYNNALTELRHEYIMYRRSEEGSGAGDEVMNAYVQRLVAQKALIWAGVGSTRALPGRESDTEKALQTVPAPVLGQIDHMTTPLTSINKWNNLRPQFQGYLQGRVALSNQAIALLLRTNIDFDAEPDALRQAIRDLVMAQDSIMSAWDDRLSRQAETTRRQYPQ